MENTIRINKRMADLGLCSRREADALIEENVVFVNGTPAVMGQKVSETDKITINKDIAADKQYYAYYKGRGVITHSPAEHEIDIAMKLAKDYNLTGVYPVGRLDKDSEGLIIITNDGRITGPLLDPSNNIEKTYLVEVDKRITGQFMQQLENGVDIEGYLTKPASATRKSDLRFVLTITEGKKHQIRRMCAALGYQVQSLKRSKIANIELGDIKPNQYRKITKPELKELFKTLKI